VRLDRKDLAAAIAFSFALALSSCNGGGGPDKTPTPTKIPEPMPSVDAFDRAANVVRELFANGDSEETPVPIQANMDAVPKK
jgi:hypothetical protein